MKPLIWQTSEKCENRHVMDYKWRERKTDSIIFMQAKHLPCPDTRDIKCSLDPKEYDLIFESQSPPEEFLKFDCLPNNTVGHSPLVNQKVLDIFMKICPRDIQAFPATIISEKNSSFIFENHGYWLINIIREFDAIDCENSVLSFYEHGMIRSVKKLVFLDNNIYDFFISRVQNDHALKIVSPSLAEAFKEANVTGVEFIEDKDY